MKSEEIFKLSEEKYNFNMTAFSFRSLRMLQIPFYYMKALYRYDLNSKSREQYTGINTDFSSAIELTLVDVKRHKQQLGND